MPEDTRKFVPQPWKMIAEGQGWNNQHKTSGKPQVKIVCKTEAGETVDVVVYSEHINHDALAGAEIVVTNVPDRNGVAKTAWYNKRKEGGYGVWAFDQSVTVDGDPFKTWARAHPGFAGTPAPGPGASPFTPSPGPGRSPSKGRTLTLAEHRVVVRESVDFHLAQNLDIIRNHFEPEITARVEIVAAAFRKAHTAAMQETIMLDRGTIKEDGPDGEIPF